MIPSEGNEWYWCFRHERVEGRGACPAKDRLGPYASPQEARNWKERVEERNQRWDAADERWRRGGQ
ncbi:MAG TPA: hypothetical protein VG452_11140 [Egibacteraceae bacterium]|nr:hypothetical protein [Actinomycetota bacterium]HWB72762.1 hypothetical protein [Egibacteraceae bacterium]